MSPGCHPAIGRCKVIFTNENGCVGVMESKGVNVVDDATESIIVDQGGYVLFYNPFIYNWWAFLSTSQGYKYTLETFIDLTLYPYSVSSRILYYIASRSLSKRTYPKCFHLCC